MKPILSFLCAFLLFPALLWSQGPGYMGKRTVAGYGIHFSPVTFGSTASNKTLFGHRNGTAEKGYFRLNFAHELFIERALSTHWLFGASLKYMQTGYDNRSDVGSETGRPSGYYTINAVTFTPFFKAYHRGYIAPWGRYFIIGPSVSMMRSKHDGYMHIAGTVNNHDTLITEFGSDNERHFSADLLLGFGRNRIFMDRITLDYGFHFHFLAALTTLEAFSAGPIFGPPLQEEYISETMRIRMRGANRFNVFIKVGYLF